MTGGILYYGDNLNILRTYIKEESVDLIYLDPPFNSKRDYNIIFKEPSGQPSQSQIRAFEDSWKWDKKAQETFEYLLDTNNVPADVSRNIKSVVDFVGRDSLSAYLVMMTIRLIELKRVLKSTGSIFLHCNPTVSRYLGIIMDTIFGLGNFVNEIIWSHPDTPGRSDRYFPRKHDTILWYVKNKDHWTFNDSEVRVPILEESKVRYKTFRALGGRKYIGGQSAETGKVPEDVWQIPAVKQNSKEALGYPTQKPLVLLERIIAASSNKGDVVLDPFCGLGTTLHAAQKLERNWIGIDITHLAINLVKNRLFDAFGIVPEIVGEPSDLEGARQLAMQDSLQFQWWVLSLIGARPFNDEIKKGADRGIDGIIYNPVKGSEKVYKGIVQVKSDQVDVKHIRDLIGTMEKEKADYCIFITLEKPTGPMNKEASKEGYFKDVFNQDIPKIQIFTVEQLLNGKKPIYPVPPDNFKKAEREKVAKSNGRNTNILDFSGNSENREQSINQPRDENGMFLPISDTVSENGDEEQDCSEKKGEV